MIGYFFRAVTGGSLLQRTLRKHFGGVPLSEIVTAAREFPITSRIDVQTALDHCSHPARTRNSSRFRHR
jgi:hypothetical protein